MPRIHYHVGSGRHVTLGAKAPLGAVLVEMMACGIKFFSRMTLQADCIAGRTQLQTVWLVTVAAGYPGVLHLALEKGSIDVHFVVNLAIGMVQSFIQQSWEVVVEQWLTMNILMANRGAPGVATRAHFDFSLTGPWLAVHRVAGLWAERPTAIPALVELYSEAFARFLFSCFGGLPGPGNVICARPVTSLAGDIDLQPGRRKRPGDGVVILLQLG